MAKSRDRNAPAAVVKDALALTQKNFEKELQELAQKAKEQTIFRRLKDSATPIIKILALLAAAGGFSAASQLNLSPVYGEIPASIWHDHLINLACFVGWAGGDYLDALLPWKLINLLPVVAIFIPFIQNFLFGFSNTVGIPYGPVITEALTIFPLIAISAASVATLIDELDIIGGPAAGPGVVSFVLFRFSNSCVGWYMQKHVSETFFHTRIGYEVILGAVYVLLAPSKLLVYALPALLHTALFNPHVQTSWATQKLRSTLAIQGYELLARQESLTGYISVLQSTSGNFRLMRCDHSILGGEWVMPRGDSLVAEPIYAIFTMLEAIRLIEVPQPVPDKKASALVIGAGVGTSPGAFIAHGINTTIVEIDPVVMDYASKYFDLSPNHNGVVADAVKYMEGVANSTEDRYDYIIHDVFTGGAEPVNLFTDKFMKNLQASLKPDGVIAINYASDLLQPTTHLILRTILSVFPSCRIFRELDFPTEAQLKEEEQDWTNMVLFCRGRSSAPVTFRDPIVADFLGSGARLEYMMPKIEIPLETVDTLDMSDVLGVKNTMRLTETQRKSAVGHWRVMRTVLPPKIWELW